MQVKINYRHFPFFEILLIEFIFYVYWLICYLIYYTRLLLKSKDWSHDIELTQAWCISYKTCVHW